MKQTNKMCHGCGIILQDSDPNLVGYTNNLANDYCQSCFKLNNYGVADSHLHPVLLPEFKRDSVVVVICSVLFLDTLFQTNLARITNNKLIFVINQVDLLPNDTNLDLMINKITDKARRLNIKFYDIILMSALNKADLLNLRNYLLDFNESNIYLIGIQNSGKTTIFKYLTNNDKALSIKKAALTLDTLTGQLEDKVILDTPGLFQQGYLHQFYSYDVYKRILPSTKLKPVIYQLANDSSVIVDGLIALNIVKLENPSVVFYYNNLKLHKTKVTRTVELLANWQSHFNYGFDQYVETTFKLPNKVKYQITTADFGFIHLIGPATIKLLHPAKMHITQMEALFK